MCRRSRYTIVQEGMNLKKIGLMLAAVLSVAVMSGVQAQKNPGKMTGGKPVGGKMTGAKTAASSVSGPVKGAVTGKTFVIGSSKGPVSVDVSKGTVRMQGKFFSLAKVTPGSMVTATGTMTGTTLMATNVNVTHLEGGKTAPKASKGSIKPGKMPGGKMGKM